MKKFFYSFLLFSFVFASCDDSTEGIGSLLTDVADQIDVNTSVFAVKSESVIIDSVLPRTNIAYLGKVKDPETGTYITSNFTTQFHTLSNYRFPGIDSLVSKVNGKAIADSVELLFYYSSHYGDTLSTMKCILHEMERPLEENKTYYSFFSPKDAGYIREGGIHKQKTYTLSDFSVSDNERWSTLPNFRITLNDTYVDKAGNVYNNYGSYIMQKYYENPDYFKNSQAFLNNVCPGFYLESTSGLGSMAYIDLTQMNVYFRYSAGDSIYNGIASFAGTEEVLQKTNVSQAKEDLLTLVNDNSCTYVKSPSGLYTKITLPVDEILKGHENDTLSSVKLTMMRYNNEENSKYLLPSPQTLLIIHADSVVNFFAKNKIADYRESFISSLNKNTNSYTFGNVATLVRMMADKKQEYIKMHPGCNDSDYSKLFPDWNKAIVVPVSASYTTINSASVLTRVTNDMSLTSTRLYGGKSYPDAIKVEVTYAQFK